MDDPARDCGIFSTVVRGEKVPLRRVQLRRRGYSIIAAEDGGVSEF